MMSKKDKPKIAFITSQWAFNYKVMPFGLKNAGATFQRLMDEVLKDQKGWNIELYVDDTIIKTKTEVELVLNLRETFEKLRKYNLKLNLKKCISGVKSGKFLGFMMSETRTKANP